MKYLFAFFLFVVLFMQCTPKPTALTADEKAIIVKSVNGVIDEIIAAINAGDAPRLLATADSTDSNFYYGTGIATAITLPVFTKGIKGAFDRDKQDVDFPNRHVSVLDSENAVAIFWGTVKYTPRKEGQLPYTLPTSLSIVFQKRNDKWTVVHVHESIDAMKKVVDSTRVMK